MSTPAFSEIELALTSSALSGDAGGLYRIASSLMDDGVGFDALLFDYLIPTERALGKRWQQGDYLVAEEHAATAAIETVISLLSGMFDQPKNGVPVVVATAEGDDHSLPARAAAAHLLFLGYRTTFLGANVPGADLREFLETEPPTALVLSCAMTTHLLGARSVIEAAHSVGIPVVVGGKAFGPNGVWADVVGADVCVSSLSEVAPALEHLPAPGKAGRALPETLVDLVAVRAAVVAEAEAELAGRTSAGLAPRLRDENRLLESAVESALLVDDEQVVVDMLDWQLSSLQAHGYDATAVADSLQAALDAAVTPAGAVLARARETAETV